MSIKPKASHQAHLVHAPHRFGLEGNQIFNYETGQYVPATGESVSKDGFTYDLARVAKCIREGRYIEDALTDADPGEQENALADASRRIDELQGQVEALTAELDGIKKAAFDALVPIPPATGSDSADSVPLTSTQGEQAPPVS